MKKKLFNAKSASIIIVNYNGRCYLDNLFTSLACQTFKNFEVIFVDNASTDKSVEIAYKYKHNLSIKVIQNRTNLGFCFANNQALDLSKGMYVVFLNNDTRVDVCWLEELVKRADSPDKPGIVVSCIIDEDSKMPSYGSDYDFYGATLTRTVSTGGDFFYGCGASLLVNKEVLQSIGGLDSALFMYQDDPDLSWRCRLLNRKVVCAQRSICYHLQPPRDILASNLTMPVWKFEYAHAKNRIRVLFKNYSYVGVVRRLILTIVLVQLRGLLLAVKNHNPAYIKAIIIGLIWNLRNLSDTLKERYKIQSMRNVKDRDIEKYMLPYSVEIWSLKLLFRWILHDK